MTNGINKNVFVLPGPTGPTGKFEMCNIFATGPTGIPNGRFATWKQLTGPTGSSGPTGTFKTIIDAGVTGVTGMKSIIVPGYARSGGIIGSTWDPAHTDAAYTLSNTNHTATMNGSASAYTVGTRPKLLTATGKYYMEFSFTGVSGTVAIALADATYIPPAPINTTQSFVYVNNNFLACWGNTATDVVWPATTTIDFAIDTSVSPMRFYERTNNGAWCVAGNPAADTGGMTPNTAPNTSLRIAMSATAAGMACTMNTGDSAFVRTPPAGYSAWG